MADSPSSRPPCAVLLFSGGLDSILAAELLLRTGVEVVLLRFRSIFFPAREAGYVPDCPVVERDISERMAGLLREPEYGFGKNVNPCLDCKQMMYRLAGGEMGRRDADFVATGEVLGQRPMSQRKDAFRRMEKGAGMVEMVLRPLSARLLPPTEPERNGLVRRADVLDIQGRSRKRQMALAEQWGIHNYPSPAGGCRLTDPNYAERVELLREKDRLTTEHLRAIRCGRLFDLGDRSYLLVGRNQEDNEQLLGAAPPRSRLLRLKDRPGPLACLVGEPCREALEEARRLVIRYSRFDEVPRDEVSIQPVEEAQPVEPSDPHSASGGRCQ